MIALLGTAEVSATLPELNLSGDTVVVPWTPERRRGPEPRPTRVVFLNFDGQILNCEGDNAPLNNARLACPPQELTNIPPFSPAGYTCGSVAACKEIIRAMLVQRWSDWNIRFVTERPEEGPYEMAMIGGSGVGESVLGIAPLDCLDSNDNSVSFSFSADIAGIGTNCPEEVLATTISHEVGHALGLCHNNKESSIMFPAVNGCEQVWACGAVIDPCGCGGDALCPNDYLPDILGPAGPDTVDPIVFVLSPLSGVTVPSEFTVSALVRDDRVLATIDVTLDAIRVADAEPGVTGEYSWSLPAVPPGHVQVCVVAVDEYGNEGRDCVNLVVDPDVSCVEGDCCCGESCCRADAECGCSGRLPNGEECSLDQDCRGGLCDENPWDLESSRRCTEGCAEDAECPSGMACVPGEGGGRGRCWSYVTAEGLGQPCHSDVDCESDRLGCVFPTGCTEVPASERIEGATCVGDGFCSLACGADASCPPRFTCADVGGVPHCRFAGVETDVSGGCTMGSRAVPAAWLLLLGLAALAFRLRGEHC